MVQGTLVIFLIVGVTVFFIVEIVSVVIGISMTRTITGAVHRLYQGTQKVIEGDFSHRIEVTGNDQLAELSRVFQFDDRKYPAIAGGGERKRATAIGN